MEYIDPRSYDRVYKVVYTSRESKRLEFNIGIGQPRQVSFALAVHRLLSTPGVPGVQL